MEIIFSACLFSYFLGTVGSETKTGEEAITRTGSDAVKFWFIFGAVALTSQTLFSVFFYFYFCIRDDLESTGSRYGTVLTIDHANRK